MTGIHTNTRSSTSVGRAVGSDFHPTPKSVSCSGRGSEAHERWVSYARPKAARNAAAENTGPGQLAQPGSREIPTLQGRDKRRTIWEKVRPGIQPVSGALEDGSKVLQKDTRVQSREECHLWVLPQPLFCMCVGVGGAHMHTQSSVCVHVRAGMYAHEVNIGYHSLGAICLHF